MSQSFQFIAYRILATLYEPFIPRLLKRRLAKGKEDPDRVHEKRGQPSAERPDGPLLWFHAVGVGEVQTLPAIIKMLRAARPDITILVTSSSLTSSRAFQASEGVIHQFLPFDTPRAIKRFLNHWRPNLTVWVDQDVWPLIVHHTHTRGVPLMLINGRMHAASFAKRVRGAGLYRYVYGLFNAIYAQDHETETHFEKLGVRRVEVTGSLKQGGVPLRDWPDLRQSVENALGNRPRWLAAPLHMGDLLTVMDAQKQIIEAAPKTLLIIAPRNPKEATEITRACEGAGFVTCQQKDGLPGKNCQIYVTDQIGQMGLWYRVVDQALIGGSFCAVEGHNPFEAANLDTAILHGPRVGNFDDSYVALHEENAALKLRSATALAEAVLSGDTQNLRENAQKVLAKGPARIERTVHEILARFPL